MLKWAGLIEARRVRRAEYVWSLLMRLSYADSIWRMVLVMFGCGSAQRFMGFADALMRVGGF